MPLSTPRIRTARHPGRLADGRGLYLHVGPAAREAKDPLAGKSFEFRYQRDGKEHWMGLGPLATIGLARARELAQEARGLLLKGIDPLAQRRAHQRERTAEAITFAVAADAYIAANRAAWRSPKSEPQWRASLAAYVYPAIGDLPVREIATKDVLGVLDPIWRTKPETAARVRSRIELIWYFAKARGWASGECPAAWKGNLQSLLPARRKIARVVHHPALDWREAPAFMAALRADDSLASLAMQFLVLTATRSAETLGATWDEIDLDNALWTIPPNRMKAHKEHRVPLCTDAAALLRRLPETDRSSFVFPGRGDRPLAHSTPLDLLARMGRRKVTAHGMRSTFRDWAAETGQPGDLAEAALAHVRGDATHAAYQRGDLLQRRRHLMAAWAAYCREGPATVVPLRRRVGR
jgi:integrase